jgi:hypothetical protein
MQSSKSSKKTHKNAEEAVVAASELNATVEVKPKPRLARSSKPKKSEAGENTLPKHHHKINSSVTPGTPVISAASTAGSARPARQITREEIAALAHSYWMARDYAHGFAEEDWLRAERQLTSGSPAN